MPMFLFVNVATFFFSIILNIFRFKMFRSFKRKREKRKLLNLKQFLSHIKIVKTKKNPSLVFHFIVSSYQFISRLSQREPVLCLFLNKSNWFEGQTRKKYLYNFTLIYFPSITCFCLTSCNPQRTFLII